MFGETEPLAPSATTRARKQPGATVTFDVRWCRRRTRYQLRKLPDEQFAEYKRANMAAQKWVGEHVRHFDRPFSEWRAADLDSILADMVTTRRQCPESPAMSIDRRTYVRVSRFNLANGRRDRLSIYVHVGGREYGAELEITKAQVPQRTIAEWVAALDPYNISITEQKSGVAISIEDHKSLLWTPGAPDPDPNGSCTPAGVSAAGLDALASVDAGTMDDDPDDDLDVFEKAARRRLHGDKNIPSTSRDRAESPGKNTGSEQSDRATICAAAYRLTGFPLRALAFWAERFMKAEGR